MEIKYWLQDKNRDYATGVELYQKSSRCNPRLLKQLQRGKNNRNLSILIRELRNIKNPQPQPLKKLKTASVKVSKKESIPISSSLERSHYINKSSNTYFKKVRHGDLPKELRPRFKKLKDLLYEMNEIKFELNDLPAEAEDAALELQLKIETLDQEKDLIWREIEHWTKHKTFLPTKTKEDFSKIPPHLLAVKKANLASSISKISRRIETWESSLETMEDKTLKLKTEQQINRSRKKLHQHELNLIQIKQLLHE